MATSKSEIIVAHSLGNSLANFRDIYNRLPSVSDTVVAEDQEKHAKGTEKRLLQLLTALQTSPICFELFSRRRENLLDDIVWLISAVRSGQFEVDNLHPLLKAIRDGEPDEIIWDKMCEIVTESTSFFRLVPSFQQTF